MRIPTSLLVLALLAACRESDRRAWERGDPLHDEPIALPPPAEWEPPASAPAQQMIRVPPPPFSPGIFPCSRCHVGGEPEEVDRPAFPHRTHLDFDLVCADCHGPDDEDAEPKVPEVATCLECHEEDEGGAVTAYLDAVRSGEGTYAIPRRWHNEHLVFSHALHRGADVECAACHGPVSNGPFAKPKAVTLMKQCTDCHEKQGAPTACASCHEKDYEPQHGVVLRHAEDQRGCLDCHNPDDRDTLRLANGTTVPFEESYLLCGQCHGPKLRDWKQGLHGKRTGMWDGQKRYLLCVHCHSNPHQPQFPKMAPDPPPMRPEDIR